jgi:RimJ/RimL family protein N-acetyltransferase
VIEPDDISRFRVATKLRDGRPVVIRVARADDRGRLALAFGQLDPQTIYTRFFGYRKSFSESELARLDRPDFDRAILLVVTIGDGADEAIIAGATCAIDDAADGERTAELAFTVEEDYQRQGLASTLLQTITALARSRGIQRFTAEVLAGNKAMRAVFERSGMTRSSSSSDGIVHYALSPGADAQ